MLLRRLINEVRIWTSLQYNSEITIILLIRFTFDQVKPDQISISSHIYIQINQILFTIWTNNNYLSSIDSSFSIKDNNLSTNF